tara:strand:- start:71 stop:652 length:582 start_codon:yes stop_codon:yes gene_type:complete
MIISIIVTIIISVKAGSSARRVNIKPNLPIIIIPNRKQFTEDYTMGILKTLSLKKNNCYFVEFYPLDKLQGIGVQMPTLQSVIVHRDYIKPIADFSSRRLVIIANSRHQTDMPDSMQDTEIGEFMSREGQKAYIKKTFGKMISHGDQAIEESMGDYARGGIPRNWMAQLKEFAFAKGSTQNQENPEDKDKNSK